MAYGVLRFTVHREEASQTTPEARGLPSPAAAWKGMGPCGYHKPPSLAISSCFGYLLLLLGVMLMSAEGISAQGEGCLVERCSDEFQLARQNLDLVGPGPHDSQKECTALRTYNHCITRTVGCQGNIMYYTLRNIVRKQMEEYNCTSNGEKFKPSDNKPQTMVPAICLYSGKKTYRHCGLFGDPHLRTFYEQFQTCKVKGAWPLVNNDYLIVQVTNDPVEGNTDATATSKLTVIVKGNPECTSKDFQTYQAQSNSLPNTFDDGRVSVGPYNSLELVEVDPGRHIEIHVRYINTVVVVRQIGRYFTFSIKMPEELVNQSSSSQDLQLCVRGCPQSELINYQQYLATRRYTPAAQDVTSVEVGEETKPAVTRSHAEKVCKEAKLVDFYFDSCVFDLMATGDQNFTLSALSSLQDMLKLDPKAAPKMDNRTTLDTYDKQYGSNNAAGGVMVWRTFSRHQVLLLLLLTLLARVLCSR